MANRFERRRRLNEAVKLLEGGDASVAEQRARALLASGRDLDALHLLGCCQLALGRNDEALQSLSEASSLDPNHAGVLHDLGRAHSARGEWQAAAQAYVRAISLDPDNARNYLYLGPIYEFVGDLDSAERAYRHALELEPTLAAAAGNLASLHEKANRMQEAEALAARALGLDADDATANLVQAQLDLRAGRHRQAAERLQRLLGKPLSAWNRSLAGGRLGAALDKLDDTEQAFAAFTAAKQALLDTPPPVTTRLYEPETLAAISARLDALFTQPAIAGGEAPVFLVGFPRSGTTLLDQVLSSHPRIAVLEEKNAMADFLQEFATSAAGLERLQALDAVALARHRERYWKRVAEGLPQPRNGRLLVDKLPLYTLFLPVIHRLFPEARVIFAVRDPRDVVLSCFMHPFGLNEAMRHFLTLEGSAGFYAEAMDMGLRSLDHLGSRARLLRYEALVDDLESAARGLCAFLALPWDAAMLQFHDTARKRRINTPSYHQVVQPVYRSALERWRRYQRQLAPVLPRLAPYVERFGYRHTP